MSVLYECRRLSLCSTNFGRRLPRTGICPCSPWTHSSLPMFPTTWTHSNMYLPPTTTSTPPHLHNPPHFLIKARPIQPHSFSLPPPLASVHHHRETAFTHPPPHPRHQTPHPLHLPRHLPLPPHEIRLHLLLGGFKGFQQFL